MFPYNDYKFEIGLDGNIYAVFYSEEEMQMCPKFQDCRVACFGGYNNALQIFNGSFGL